MHLYLADLGGYTEDEVKQHICSDKFCFFAGRYDTDGATRAQEVQQFLAGP